MFRVRAGQMAAMSQAIALEKFKPEMVAHLRTFAPHDAARLGEAGVLAVVRLGVERGRVYGLVNTGLLRLYVELMFMFGSFFDTDPRFPWAGEALRDPTIGDPTARAEHLHAKMLWYLEAVDGGPARALDTRAFRGLDEVLIDGISPADPRFEPELVRALSALHPTRAAYLGEARLRGLVREAAGCARHHALGRARDVSLVAFILFTLGHGFAADPLLPWIEAALADPAPDSLRGDRLERGLRAHLDRLLDWIERG